MGFKKIIVQRRELYLSVSMAGRQRIPIIFVDLDFQKLFDSTSHIKLSSKREYLSFIENVLKRIESYLYNRTQYVYVNNVKSDPKEEYCKKHGKMRNVIRNYHSYSN